MTAWLKEHFAYAPFEEHHAYGAIRGSLRLRHLPQGSKIRSSKPGGLVVESIAGGRSLNPTWWGAIFKRIYP